MITLSLTRGRFYNAQHQNPAVLLHPHFSSETAITLIISHNGLPHHSRACKSLSVILCTWDTFVCGVVFQCRGLWTSSLLIKSHNLYPSFLCRWYSTTHPSPTTTINLNCALPTCCFQPNSPSFNCLLVHKQWIRIAHSSVLHTQLDKWVALYMHSKRWIQWNGVHLDSSLVYQCMPKNALVL